MKENHRTGKIPDRWPVIILSFANKDEFYYYFRLKFLVLRHTKFLTNRAIVVKIKYSIRNYNRLYIKHHLIENQILG